MEGNGSRHTLSLIVFNKTVGSNIMKTFGMHVISLFPLGMVIKYRIGNKQKQPFNHKQF